MQIPARARASGRHGGRRPAIHAFARVISARRGWWPYGHHDVRPDAGDICRHRGAATAAGWLCVETRSLACHRLNRFAPRVVKAHPMTADLPHMQAALALARRGLGTTWPNPSVGCVIVRDGRVVGRGNTAPGGRPHAEPIALAMAGDLAKGATAYVTLEPCCHWGRSPPCTDALIAAGIARVVIATGDPDPRVNGQGLEKLRAAGITVETGLLEAEAKDILLGFSSRVTLGRPMVTLKLASTLDGRIATQRRREPVDHRHARPPPRPRPARPSRRGHGRRRHRPGRQSRPDLPHPGLPPDPGRPHHRRQPPAHAADLPARRHRRRSPDLVPGPRGHRPGAADGVHRPRRDVDRRSRRLGRRRSDGRVSGARRRPA